MLRNGTIIQRFLAILCVLVVTYVATPASSEAAVVTVPGWTGNSNNTSDITATPLAVGDSASFSHTGINAPFSFTDKLLFIVTGSGVEAAATKVEIGPRFAITNFTMKLFDAANVEVASSVGSPTAYFIASILPNVQYTLQLTGTASGTATNSYSGNITVVPIPAALPLFLTALAGAGLIARRRQAA